MTQLRIPPWWVKDGPYWSQVRTPRPAVVMFSDRAPQADHNTLKSLPNRNRNKYKDPLTQFPRLIYPACRIEDKR